MDKISKDTVTNGTDSKHIMGTVRQSSIFSEEFIAKLREKQKIEGKPVSGEVKKVPSNNEFLTKLKAMAEKNRKEGKVQPITVSNNSKLMELIRDARAKQAESLKKAAEQAEKKGDEVVDSPKENPEKAGE